MIAFFLFGCKVDTPPENWWKQLILMSVQDKESQKLSKNAWSAVKIDDPHETDHLDALTSNPCMMWSEDMVSK